MATIRIAQRFSIIFDYCNDLLTTPFVVAAYSSYY